MGASAITSNAATSISVTSATGIVIGSTLYIGAEQLTVTAIDGTTAAVHGNGAAVSADGNASNADFQVLVSSDDTTTPAVVTTDLDGVDATTGTTYVLPSALVIGAVADGSGTLTLADTEKTSAALEIEDRTFIYTAAAEMSGGSLQMIVPAGWSAPNETDDAAGEVAMSVGKPGTLVVNTDARTITISGLNLKKDETTSFVYAKAPAPEVAGTYTFATVVRGDDADRRNLLPLALIDGVSAIDSIVVGPVLPGNGIAWISAPVAADYTETGVDLDGDEKTDTVIPGNSRYNPNKRW